MEKFLNKKGITLIALIILICIIIIVSIGLIIGIKMLNENRKLDILNKTNNETYIIAEKEKNSNEEENIKKSYANTEEDTTINENKEKLDEELKKLLSEGLDDIICEYEFNTYKKYEAKDYIFDDLFNKNLIETELNKFYLLRGALAEVIEVHDYNIKSEPDEYPISGIMRIDEEGIKKAYKNFYGIDFNAKEIYSYNSTYRKAWVENGKFYFNVITGREPIKVNIKTKNVKYNNKNGIYTIIGEFFYDFGVEFENKEFRKVSNIEIQYQLDTEGNKIFKSIMLKK